MRNRKSKNHKFMIGIFGVFGLFVVALAIGFGFHLQKKWQRKDRRFLIKSILQTGPQKEALKTVYLAELLELSTDKPVNLINFDCKKAEEKLLASPLIKKASIKKIKPDSLYIDYEVRTPIAWLLDYKNVAVDEEGYIFPVYPYLTPKHLPEIYLNLSAYENSSGSEFIWNSPLQGKQIELALKILKSFSLHKQEYPFKLKRIDVSHAFFPSLGKREVVLLIEDELTLHKEDKVYQYIFPICLRMTVTNYLQQMGNYAVLREKIFNDYRRQLVTQTPSSSVIYFKPKVLDLRIDKLGFIDNRS